MLQWGLCRPSSPRRLARRVRPAPGILENPDLGRLTARILAVIGDRAPVLRSPRLLEPSLPSRGDRLSLSIRPRRDPHACVAHYPPGGPTPLRIREYGRIGPVASSGARSSCRARASSPRRLHRRRHDPTAHRCGRGRSPLSSSRRQGGRCGRSEPPGAAASSWRRGDRSQVR